MSRYSLFVERWQNCTRCNLRHLRKRVVLAKGKLPCDVLFCGEAPGESEDAEGSPFVGPAGQLLNRMVKSSIGGDNPELDSTCSVKVCNLKGKKIRLGYTNLVCCIPLEEPGKKLPQPSSDEIVTCGERLREYVSMASPQLIFAVGSLADKWLPRLLPNNIKPIVHIDHPAYIIRLPELPKYYAAHRCQIQILSAVEKFVR